jgi:hypothetical protein
MLDEDELLCLEHMVLAYEAAPQLGLEAALREGLRWANITEFRVVYLRQHIWAAMCAAGATQHSSWDGVRFEWGPGVVAAEQQSRVLRSLWETNILVGD